MRNNKQYWLSIIRIDMSLLKYYDDKMLELYGKTYKQIEKCKEDEIHNIMRSLHKIYETKVVQ